MFSLYKALLVLERLDTQLEIKGSIVIVSR
jgi:hypothetical protein